MKSRWPVTLGAYLMVAMIPSVAHSHSGYSSILDSTLLSGSKSEAKAFPIGGFVEDGAPDCSTMNPLQMMSGLDPDDLEGEILGLDFRIGGIDGPTFVTDEVPTNGIRVMFDDSGCQAMYDREIVVEIYEEYTHVYLVLRTSAYPDGEIAGRLLWVDAGAPVLETTWGEVKSIYRSLD